jgi:hypothetical protein
LVLLALVAAIAVAAGLLYWLLRPAPPRAEQDPERVFAGSSESFVETVVLPTLDTDIPEKRSAIWCISLQLAWNRLKNDLAGEPIRLANAQQFAERLNRAQQSEDDVATDDFLAMAGRVDQGIVQRIESALAAKFPQNTMPPVPGNPRGVVASGYLKADVRYAYQFFNHVDWLSFKASDGRTTRVRSFGLPDFDRKHPLVGGCRQQVRVLFREGGRFAVDLSHGSKPNQIVLAKMPRKSTLADTLAELSEKMAAAQPTGLTESATLLVPNMQWRVDHDFRELAGQDKDFLNAALTGLFLEKAFQFVDFKMDRTGARVESGAYLVGNNGHTPEEDPNPDRYHFDQPFLILMKKRGAKHPFFVMWVDNAELLSKQ